MRKNGRGGEGGGDEGACRGAGSDAAAVTFASCARVAWVSRASASFSSQPVMTPQPLQPTQVCSGGITGMTGRPPLHDWFAKCSPWAYPVQDSPPSLLGGRLGWKVLPVPKT